MAAARGGGGGGSSGSSSRAGGGGASRGEGGNQDAGELDSEFAAFQFVFLVDYSCLNTDNYM